MKTANVLFSMRPWLAACTLALLAACGGGGRDPILGLDGAGVTNAGVVAPGVTPPVVTPPVIVPPVVTPPVVTPPVIVPPVVTPPVVTPPVIVPPVVTPPVVTPPVVVPPVVIPPVVIPPVVIPPVVTPPVLSPPSVTAVTPANNAAGVAINTGMVSAAFNEPVSGLSGNTGFKVTCAPPCFSPTGSVSMDTSSKIATLAFTSGTPLSALTLYTVTITGARSIATGLVMSSPFISQFTTAAAPDTTRPSVVMTVPATTNPGPTTGVATNSAISALFTEDMAPSTINASSFRVTCAAPCLSPAGSVSYSVGNRTALFTPVTALASATTYTATITTGATDLAGNALAGNQAPLPAPSNYIWTFTTSGPVSAANISVLSTSPAAGSSNICTDASINATFNVPSGLRMDPLTINSATFTLTGPGQNNVTPASVLLDAATGKIATFKPLAALTAGTTYLATVRSGASGVKDLAIPANTMAADFTWTFTVVSCAITPSPSPIVLGSAASFGSFGGSAGITNSGINTIVNGDIGTTAASTSVTGFHDAGPGCIYTETPLNIGMVNGKIYTAPPSPTAACPSEGTAVTFAIATRARADALAAYNALVALPGGPNPGAGNLANLTLAPGVYTAASGAFRIQGGNLTLDAQGNANAVWVFQMATTLTVGGPGAAFPSSITLTNGAQAKNVFWQVGSAAVINAGGGGTMAGTIISQAGVVFSTAGAASILTLNGRALSLGASVTMVNTVINVPAP